MKQMPSCVRRRPRKHHLQLFTVALLQAPLSVHTKGGRFNQVRLNTSESERVLRTVMLLLHIVILSAVCTALYHCLLTELPHICTANSVLLMKQARKRLLTVPVNFSGYFRSSSLRLRCSYSVELAGYNCSFHAGRLARGCSVAYENLFALVTPGSLHWDTPGSPLIMFFKESLFPRACAIFELARALGGRVRNMYPKYLPWPCQYAPQYFPLQY